MTRAAGKRKTIRGVATRTSMRTNGRRLIVRRKMLVVCTFWEHSLLWRRSSHPVSLSREASILREGRALGSTQVGHKELSCMRAWMLQITALITELSTHQLPLALSYEPHLKTLRCSHLLRLQRVQAMKSCNNTGAEIVSRLILSLTLRMKEKMRDVTLSCQGLTGAITGMMTTMI